MSLGYDDQTLGVYTILSNLLKLEEKYMVSSAYFDNVQKDIHPHMRNLVATWMMEICEEQRCEKEIFPLSLSNFDRFLSVCPIKEDQLLPIAFASLLVASKLKSKVPFRVEKLVEIAGASVTAEQLLDAEIYFLKLLKWDTLSVTPIDFIFPLLQRIGIEDPQLRSQIELQAVSYVNRTCLDEKFFIYTPSMIAASSIAAAMNQLNTLPMSHDQLLQKFQESIGTDQDMLQQCFGQVKTASLPSAQASNELRKLVKTPTDIEMVD